MSDTKTKYMTVVFAYEEGAIPSILKDLMESFEGVKKIDGVEVTAVSSCDEITRCEKLEKHLCL